MERKAETLLCLAVAVRPGVSAGHERLVTSSICLRRSPTVKRSPEQSKTCGVSVTDRFYPPRGSLNSDSGVASRARHCQTTGTSWRRRTHAAALTVCIVRASENASDFTPALSEWECGSLEFGLSRPRTSRSGARCYTRLTSLLLHETM